MMHSVLDQLPQIMGHRGACGHAPENTLSSIEMAATLGSKFIEIDVCVTKDNIAVIHHDTDVDRCTNGHGPVLLKTLEEIKLLDASIQFSPHFTGEKIPTLKEAILTIQKLGLGLNLELKPCKGWQIPTTERVAAELQEYLPENVPLLVSSFNIEALKKLGSLMPDVPLGYLTEAIPPDWERRLVEAGCASLHCEKDFVTKENVTAVKAAGYKFLVYTVNDPEMANRFLDWGVDSVITDFPDRLFAGLQHIKTG
ncbi:glycerophosphoryl diester phosphodiesterase [Sneathiella marina]|uniref:Glycerophosphoryl diester phosphodiesterase n=1 Tax=Sneathiella marina TaxID=2950108 RepID=A0ABY4WEE8_9PROT|nr:glycerophosphoryl diester phosphodiesterase [Sneathiella marina]USG63011.1 glycerophosphoryl diester phosphodiesterase [Sneathiella marina]